MTADEPNSVPMPSHALRRRWIPLVALVLAALIVVTLWSIPADLFERGQRVFFSTVAGALAFAICMTWLLLGSGAALRWRILAVLLVSLGIVTSLGAVRRVEFSGDMIPSFEFRWQPTREARLESHRAQQPALHADATEPGHEWQVTDQDVPAYRGPQRDGIVGESPPLVRDWKTQPPACLWRQPVGGGYSSFAVIGDWIFTLEQRRQQEAIVAYDLATGRELWVYQYDALFQETLGGDGPRSSVTFHDGRLYALGATGILNVLDAATGNLAWSRNILEDNGSSNIDWGMCGSPLVDGHQLIVNPGNQGDNPHSHAIVAYDIDNGSLLWGAGQSKASYASPMLATLDGVKQILIFDAAGLAGYDPAGGKQLWQFAWQTQFDIHAAQPVILDDNDLLITSQSGCARLDIRKNADSWQVEERWQNRNLKGSYANPVYHEGHVYGLDEGILVCLDPTQGERRWKRGRYGHGQLLLVDNLLLILSERGELALVEATPEAYRELSLIPAIEGKTWNNPVLVRGLAVVRNHLEMAAYDLRAERHP